MARLEWDAKGKHFYETGTEKGVLYLQNSDGDYPNGVAWNGLTGFSESPDGGDATDIWADDIKYLSIRARENFKGTITAYTYPDEWMQCDGSAVLGGLGGVFIGQQTRKGFGLSYVTKVGNDTEFEDYDEKIHLIWGASASPSSKDYKTINDSPEAIEFSWEITTTPVNCTGHKATAHMTIEPKKFLAAGGTEAKLQALKNVLWGADASEAVYEETDDETPQSGKTYYTKSGNNYTVFSGSTFASGTTYYEKVSDATTAVTPHLPSPDDVLYILQNGSERPVTP